MIKIRKSTERGHASHGWLDTYHTFSFSTYYDPKHMGFRALRVINEDRVAGGGGFPPHPHRDMEIITYVLDGALEHKDSMGNGSLIQVGDVQRMSAGTGVTHSEFNHSPTTPVHLLQIWILPKATGDKPSYEQKSFSDRDGAPGKLTLIASPQGQNGGITIHQDVMLLKGVLGPEKPVDYTFAPSRHGWIQVARGEVTLNGMLLNQGDGAAISEESKIRISSKGAAEVLLFDLA